MARILLTEDDLSVKIFVKRALELDGHDIIMAENGEQAMNILKQPNVCFDLLLSDVKMPIMDGITLVRQVGNIWPDLKILLMTGFADQRERVQDLQNIVQDVILKPFSLSDIRSLVFNVLVNSKLSADPFRNTLLQA